MFLFGEILQPQRPPSLPEVIAAFFAGLCKKGANDRWSYFGRFLDQLHLFNWCLLK